MKTTRTCRRLIAFATLAAVAASANALSVDPQITIDRALNSPTLAVRYSGATATLVELRINGESVGTREVSGARSGGETSFTIDLDALKNGDNLVEIRLFDRTGRLVGGDKTNISMEKGASRGPVFVSAPKAGSSVLGPVEIAVGFGENLGKSYVSFFVDGEFKSMTNFPPFNFVWDTEKEANGWHEVEAWAIDERNETHKSGAVRVFVNNPGGRTDRVGVPKSSAVVPTRNVPAVRGLSGTESGVRAIGVAAISKGVSVARPQGLPPAVVERMVPIGNAVRSAVKGANTVRPMALAGIVATGPKSMLPTGRRLAPKLTVKAPVVPPASKVPPALPVPSVTKSVTPPPVVSTVAAAQAGHAVYTASLVAVTSGTRLPNLGAYTILLDGMKVRSDVPARVVNGLALAPLRALIEKAGGKVEWFAESKTVRAGHGVHAFELKIGEANARVDGGNLILEKAPGITAGRTLVPLSFLRDALGMDVQYDKATGNVIVSTKE